MNEDWNENKLKGNIAENAVKYLINSMPDYKCVDFGVETHIEDIKDMVRKIKENPITIKIRKMPDFVVFNEKTEETFFIEVKYCTPFDEKYIINYLEKYNEYWKGTKLIIVRQNKPHFLWVDLEKIDISTMREIKEIKGKSKALWDFRGIEKDIKKVFLDLKDEAIMKAESIVPK